jgi:hypothetical protein
MPTLCFTHGRSKHVEQLKDIDKNSLYLGDVSVNERYQKCGNLRKVNSEGHCNMKSASMKKFTVVLSLASVYYCSVQNIFIFPPSI